MADFKEDFVRFSLQKHWELILIDKQNNILNWGNNKHKIIFNRKVTKPNNKTLRFLTMKHLDFIMVTVMRSTYWWAFPYEAKSFIGI